MKVFIAVSPGFYKTRLFNELAKREDILVVYSGEYDKSSRNADFLGGGKQFNYVSYTGSTLIRFIKIFWLLFTMNYDEIIIGGYDNIFCWLPLLVTSKHKCSLIIESTFRETVTSGLRLYLKKLYVSRINRVYAPGTPHAQLAKFLGFKGEIRYWYSVGLINTIPQPSYTKRNIVSKFLFVGRLIPVKNLPWLINIFKKHPELHLTIVGFGNQEDYLKSLVTTDNIIFTGAINNTELPRYYQDADVFILPSISETWGLVVEEAINNGTPVMCSHMVGSADDLVIKRNFGVVYKLNDEEDFENKLKDICNVDNYNNYRKNISQMDFISYEKSIIEAFVK